MRPDETFQPLAHNLYVNAEKIGPVSFQELWARYAADVHRFALYLSGNPSQADDITSETFLRVWSTRDRLNLPTVKAYLFAIARNLHREDRRRSWRDEALIEMPVPSDARAIESREELRAVLAALQQLPETDRTALLLRAEQDLSYDEIALLLEMPSATVRVRVHRARLRLAEICERNLIKP